MPTLDKKVSEETAAAALDGTELLRAVQAGGTVAATVAQILTYILANLGDIVSQDANAVAFTGGSIAGLSSLTTTGFVGIGDAAPAAQLSMAGNASAAAWGTLGIAARFTMSSQTFTDTSSSGTVTNMSLIRFGSATVAANSATTYTTAATAQFSKPLTGTNVGFTDAYGIRVDRSRITEGLVLGGGQSSASWTTQGPEIAVIAATLTDTSSAASSTITTRVANSFAQPSFASTNAITVTNAVTVYIANAPAAGSGTTITNAWALYIAAGMAFFGGAVSMPTRGVTATTTAGAADRTIRCDATSGAITVNLPAAAGCQGRIYTIKKLDASANAVTIDPNGAELIDGAATLAISTQWQAKTIQSNGSSWDVL